ncbi:hypothetical protein PROFUN_06239 [Planoprotostelium fungivorum]|uniref:Nucleoside phosphorylase domain-containing protein n=1 Tax=Planoprotostelium fungivorum TaxID=1890364 RepID=A0A2P6NE40_9EUKA|nr:hypothetical protein PROFUN_06239 [Planoprotostelium fungivorum]
MESATHQPRHEATNANFPRDGEGRVHHVGVKKGEGGPKFSYVQSFLMTTVANRILSVGDHRRASVIASLFDNPSSNLVTTSSRGFTVHTGTFNKVPVTVIATGMGFPMMDFLVRECRAVVEGPMVIMRFGTCGTPQTHIPIGSVVVASEGSIFIRRNPDAWEQDGSWDEKESKYIFSKVVRSDPEISKRLAENMKKMVADCQVYEGLGATADSFYASQGRTDDSFDDDNANLIDQMLEKYSSISALEMETFHLFDLARCSKGTIRSSAAAIVLAQRRSNAFLDKATTERIEKEGGRAVLLTLSETDLTAPSNGN